MRLFRRRRSSGGGQGDSDPFPRRTDGDALAHSPPPIIDDEALARQLAAGCAECTRPAMAGRQLCDVCYQRLTAERAAIESQLAALRCAMCNAVPPRAGRRLCQECYNEASAAAQQSTVANDTRDQAQVLSQLPMRRFLGARDALNTHSQDEGGGAAAECTICCGDYEEGEEICVLPMCMHSFHAACVLEWLAKESTCPVCMRDVVEDLKALRAVTWEIASP